MQKFIASVLIPLALIGSTVLGAGVTVGLTAKRTVPVRKAVSQDEAAKPAEALPAAPAPGVVEPAPAPAEKDAAAPPIHVAHLSSDDLFAGKISVLNPVTGTIEPASDLVVWFLQNREIRASATPGVGGVFQAQGLKPGVYSIVAWGPQGYLATSVNLLPYQPPQAGAAAMEAQPISSSKVMAGSGSGIDLLAVPVRDTAKVLELANAYIPVGARSASIASPVSDRVENAAQVDATQTKLDTTMKRRTEDLSAGYTAVLSNEHRVPGRLTRMHPESGKLLPFSDRSTKAFLVSGPAVVSETWVGGDGQFQFENVSPGEFTVVVAGAEGFAAFGVQIVRPSNGAAPTGAVTESSSQQPAIFNVSLSRAAGSNGIESSVIDLANFPAAYQQMLAALRAQQAGSPPGPAGPAAGTGGGGGGGGGIGGGAGGGGGLGALGAALGAAGLAAALANDNGGRPNSP